MKEMTLTLRPYDEDVSYAVYEVLFRGSDNGTEDGLVEIPAVSYQLVCSALEAIQCETKGADRQTIRYARSVLERLRDKQLIREFNRRHEK